MQLKKHNRSKNITGALSAATCSLLSVAPSATLAVGTDSPWEFTLGALYYAEADNRVSAFEPVFRARKELNDEEFITLKLVVDSLTGASPSGAMPSTELQTFTRPSGNGSYTAAPGEIPLDDTFLDTRTQISAEWDKPLSDLSNGKFSANFSSEYDFQSLGLSATFSHDYNQRNTTLTTGISYESNSIDPSGGIPVERSDLLDPNNRREDTESRTQTDILFGITQIINRRTIMQLNFSHGQSDGYHTDPFKLVSIIDDAPGPNQGNPLQHIYENRPQKRTRNTLFWKTKHHFKKNIIDISYRYLSDDWGISSHTVDLRYTIMSSKGAYWEPHLRIYQQNAADFYQTNIRSSDAVPRYLSADYRLGDLSGTTIGIKYSRPTRNDRTIAIRLEYMAQNGDPSDGSNIGNLQNIEIIPDTNAIITQFEYSF